MTHMVLYILKKKYFHFLQGYHFSDKIFVNAVFDRECASFLTQFFMWTLHFLTFDLDLKMKNFL
jgi:hypothetical protein